MPTTVRIFSFWVLLLLSVAPAAAQTLDPAFRLNEYFQNAQLFDALQQPDGKWVVAGNFTRVNGVSQAALVRLNANGTLDQGFNANVAPVQRVEKLHLLPNGQLLLRNVVYSSGSIMRRYLVRLNPDGSLDASLNVTGLPQYATVSTLALQPNGSMVVGSMLGAGFGVLRLRSDGSIDPGFNSRVDAAYANVYQVLVQPDGKIIVGGQYFYALPSSTTLIRLNPDGSLDAGFRPVVPGTTVTGLALQPDGKVLLTNVPVPGSGQRNVVRLLANGSPDPSFVVDGRVGYAQPNWLIRQPDGKVLVGAYANDFSRSTTPRIVRLEADGGLDTSFQIGAGADGDVIRAFLQADGQILVSGSFSNFDGLRRNLALLQANGQVNAGFAPRLEMPAWASNVLVLPNSGVLVAGSFHSVNNFITDKLVRLLPDGQVDPGFTCRFSRNNSWTIKRMALQPDGKILLAGTYVDFGYEQSRFVRLHPNGTLDTSFVPAVQPVHVPSFVRLLAVQPDGKIVVGGSLTDRNGRTGLTRLIADGSPDPSFALPAATSHTNVSSGLLQADGKLVYSGWNSAGYGVWRLLPSGAPDPTFAVQLSGLNSPDFLVRQPAGPYVLVSRTALPQVLSRLTPVGAADSTFAAPVRSYAGSALPLLGVAAMAVQPDNRLLVGGWVQLAGALAYSPLVRLRADGRQDTTFNTAFFSSNSVIAANVADLAIDGKGRILVAGYFSQAGGQPAAALVRLSTPPPTSPRPLSVDVYPNPSRNVLNVLLDPTAQPRQLTLLNALGQTIRTQTVVTAETSLDVRQLPAGMYLLRVEYAKEQVTRRVVVE
jgi:uncharacterized delta-60 repeat protein